MMLKFSIIIPTYNRPGRLVTCLEAITQLDYPRDRVEVIVVNDGSEMPLEPIVAPIQEQLNLTLINQPNRGPAKARNEGAAKAQGQFLVFTDDDCTPASDWLQALEVVFTEDPQAMIGGKAINALPENVCSTASQLLIDYLYEYYNRNFQQATFFASNNLALSKELFQKLGCFDTSFPLAAGEDREFCDRALHLGYSLRYIPTATVYHAHVLTPRKFWRQHFNYGRGAYRFHKLRQVRQSQASESIKVEPLSFYTKLLLYPFSQSLSPRSFVISTLLFVSQVANVGGFFWERSRAGKMNLNS